jgi:hypothetical protein|tara:strand:+ start:5925 stop:6350 length:426 start_codon:yes stop_codon:yes gene_type:complete
MAKWGEPSDETFSEVNQVLINSGLDNLINTKIIINDEQKKKVIVVKKIPANISFAFNNDLLITVNESIFDELPPLQKRLCIEEALAGTHHNGNNIVVGTPDTNTYHSFLEKHGYDKFLVMEESIKSLYETQKNDGEDPKVD